MATRIRLPRCSDTHVQESVQEVLQQGHVQPCERVPDAELEAAVSPLLEVLLRLDEEVGDVAAGQVRDDVERGELRNSI